MLKASELVAFAKSMVGMPYWYGTCVYKCSNSLLESKTAQYPSHYKSNRTKQYNANIRDQLVCMDCVGLIKGFYWTNGGKGVVETIGNNKTFSRNYASNGMPDKSANGLLTMCKKNGAKNGAITSIPNVAGILVFSDGHVGVYIGDGKVVEARGFNYGVVVTNLSERNWTSWSFLPSSILDYEGKDGVEIMPTAYSLGERVLKHSKPMMNGDDVTELQRLLVLKGFSPIKIDGFYGADTESAVRAFQKAAHITVDGKAGNETIKALRNYVPKAYEGSESIRKLFQKFQKDMENLESYQELRKALGGD